MTTKISPSTQLFEFARTLQMQDVPADAIDAARIAIMDSIGCMFGSSNTPLVKDTIGLISQLGGGAPQATIVATRKRMSMPYAAFLNGLQANALDYDDAFEQEGKGMGHPGATIIPAALAVAEHTGATAKDFLCAVIAGYEVANRIIQAIQPTPARHSQVWGVAVHQAFGSAAAAARLLKLDRDQFHNALGLAGALSTVPAARKWNWADRPLFSPKDVVAIPSETGVRAALLASIGWQGARTILDGENGFWVMAGSDRCDFEQLTDRLGDRWTVCELSFKPYPACRWVHAALQAAESLMVENELISDDITACEVGTFEDVVTNFSDRRPRAMVDGEFSLPWTMAVILAGIPKGEKWYSPETLSDPHIHSIVDRISLHVDEEAQRRHFSDERKTMSVVRLQTIEGHKLERRITVAMGGVASPWPQGGIEEKFRSQVSPLLGSADAQQFQNAISGLGETTEFNALLSFLSGQA